MNFFDNPVLTVVLITLFFVVFISLFVFLRVKKERNMGICVSGLDSHSIYKSDDNIDNYRIKSNNSSKDNKEIFTEDALDISLNALEEKENPAFDFRGVNIDIK